MRRTLTTHRRNNGYSHHVLTVNKGQKIKIASGELTEIVERKNEDGSKHYEVVVDSRKFGK